MIGSTSAYINNGPLCLVWKIGGIIAKGQEWYKGFGKLNKLVYQIIFTCVPVIHSNN